MSFRDWGRFGDERSRDNDGRDWPEGLFRAPAPMLTVGVNFPPVQTPRDFLFAKWSKYADAVLDYSFQISRAVEPGQDMIAMASVMCAPAMAGDLALSGLTVAGDLITFTVSGGQAVVMPLSCDSWRIEFWVL
jgi:hypothetical protein